MSRHQAFKALGEIERLAFLLKQPEFDLGIEDRRALSQSLSESWVTLAELIESYFEEKENESIG